MTWFVMGLCLFVAAIAQMLMPGFALFGQAKFPLLLSVVLYYALNRELWLMTLAAFLAGFLHDGLSNVPLGCSSLLYCLAGWIVSRFRKQVDADALVTYSVFGMTVSGVLSLVLYVVLLRKQLIACPFAVGVWRSVGAAALGAVGAPIAYGVVRAMDRGVGNVEARKGVNAL